MAEEPKLTPEQQRTLDALQDAIVACDAAMLVPVIVIPAPAV